LRLSPPKEGLPPQPKFLLRMEVGMKN